MSEGQCVHIVVQDPSLVVCASHECLGLFLRADIESLVVDALEAALDHCTPLFSASRTRLHKSMFFTIILFPSVTTLRGTPFAALCITGFSSTRQYIFGLTPTNSVIRCPLFSSLKMGPGNFLLKLMNDPNEGNLLFVHFVIIVVGRGIINDHCSEQVVVLFGRGNLYIGPLDYR